MTRFLVLFVALLAHLSLAKPLSPFAKIHLDAHLATRKGFTVPFMSPVAATPDSSEASNTTDIAEPSPPAASVPTIPTPSALPTNADCQNNCTFANNVCLKFATNALLTTDCNIFLKDCKTSCGGGKAPEVLSAFEGM